MKRFSIMLAYLLGFLAILALGGSKKPANAASPVKKTTRTSAPLSSSSSKPASKPSSAPASAPVRPVPYLRGKRVYFIGDSLSAGPTTAGGQLVKLLREAGAIVTVNALVSRSARSFWAGSTKKEAARGENQLDAAINDGMDICIIFLGTNDLGGLAAKTPLSSTLKPFRAMVTQLRLAGVDVWGIGAPHYKARPEFDPFEKQLRTGLESQSIYGADHFVDAGPLTGGYWMHAGGSTAEKFAGRLFAALVTKMD